MPFPDHSNDEARVTETAVWSILFLINVFLAVKGTLFYFLFGITAAGVMPCVDPKRSPHTSSKGHLVHLSDHFISLDKLNF